MKRLHQMTNVDKANALHQLFPQEIPALLDFITGMCEAIQQDKDRNRSNWDDGFMSFDYWLSLILETEYRIKKFQNRMCESNKVFAEQLFDGFTAVFASHCITVYTSVKKHPNAKFTLAVELLFNP